MVNPSKVNRIVSFNALYELFSCDIKPLPSCVLPTAITLLAISHKSALSLSLSLKLATLSLLLVCTTNRKLVPYFLPKDDSVCSVRLTSLRFDMSISLINCCIGSNTTNNGLYCSISMGNSSPPMVILARALSSSFSVYILLSSALYSLKRFFSTLSGSSSPLNTNDIPLLLTSAKWLNMLSFPHDIALTRLHQRAVLPCPPSPPRMVIHPFGIYPGINQSTVL